MNRAVWVLMVTLIGMTAAACGPDKFYITNVKGIQGAKGDTGEKGEAGQDGVDGQDGEDGEPGTPSIIEVIDPCGNNPAMLNEVLLRLSNNQILASFSSKVSGYNTRFVLLLPGTYMTTDGSQCVFTITVDYEVVW